MLPRTFILDVQMIFEKRITICAFYCRFTFEQDCIVNMVKLANNVSIVNVVNMSNMVNMVPLSSTAL